MRNFKLWRALPGILALAFVLTSAAQDRAEVVFFKDGLVIFGDVKREGQTIMEAGQLIQVGNGFYVIDDDRTLPGPARRDYFVRRIIFSARQVAEVKPDVIKESKIELLKTQFTPLNQTPIEPFGPISSVGAWNEKWERSFTFKPLKQPEMTTLQRITLLTPYCCVVESQRHRWQSMYLTREFGPEVVLKLLYSHPELRERAGEVDPVKRSRIVRFLVQAGFHDAAEHELEQWAKDAPEKHKPQIDEVRSLVQQERSADHIKHLQRASEAGQHEWVQKQLVKFPERGTAEEVLREVRALRNKYEKGQDAVTAARRFLKELPGRVAVDAQRTVFTEAAEAILAELNVDTYPRLERFIAFGNQAERDRQQGKTPMQTPSELMALAVSGWLLGNASAETKPETGVNLWKARKFVQEYQKTEGAAGRARLLADYERNRTEVIPFDEMAQLISLLPPVSPEPKLPPNGMLPLQTELPGQRKNGTNYVVQLPREYHHGRAYPVLLVCHQAVERPGDAIDRWGQLAYEEGYIVAAPEWSTPGALKPQYNFTAEEHAAVLDTLRDVQRRFNVDNDRVFLAGAGQGGDMAFDVGLSHPDRFAGVVVQGAMPRYFGKAYAPNGMFLPFYVVAGEMASEAPKAIREVYRNWWVPSGTASLYVEYKGRGQEWFGGELPAIYEWMNRKKRANPTIELSKFIAMRPTDNRFYWLSAEGMSERCVNDANKWNGFLAPATMQGKIGDGNTVYLHITNFKSVTLWLTRGMLELEKPVTVNVNTTTKLKDRKITPSLAVLLEDFHQRGDRQRQYIAKIDLPLFER